MTSFISVKLDIHRIARDLLYNVAIVYRNLYSALTDYYISYQYSFPSLPNPLCGPRMVARLILSESVVRRVACAAQRELHTTSGARWNVGQWPTDLVYQVYTYTLASSQAFSSPVLVYTTTTAVSNRIHRASL